MKYYAGIGARATPPDVIAVMERWARLLVDRRYVCKTGACKGADQAFANAALEISVGQVELFIPWPKYEEPWWSVAQHVSGRDNVKVTVLSPEHHKAAMQSVMQYHPNPNGLKQSVWKLHARNYLIVEGVEFVICYTPMGQVTGGTGQALRICADMGIKIYNLGDPLLLVTTQRWLTEQGY